jgi:hypothetical protein
MQEAILDGKHVADQLLIKPARRMILVPDIKQKNEIAHRQPKHEQEHTL